MGQTWDRRAVLRSLGLGAAGLSVGGLGVLAGCSSDDPDRASATAAGSSTTAAPTPTVALTPYDPKVPYWEQGNFAAVTTEETATDLAVKGAIPSGLSGLFVRNGSNPPTGKALHWFLGDGMVHGVRIRDGKAAWYRNRYVQTPLHKARKDLGIPGKASNQSNVALVHHGGKLLTTGEVGWPFQLDPADLSTVGAWDFDGKLGETMTAHPKIDPVTGRMHFFGYEFLRPAITYYAADPSGQLDVVSPIPTETATMVHDFAVTDRDGVYGLIRAHMKAKELGVHLILGSEVTLDDRSCLVLLATDRRGYANLCRLLTAGRLRSPKGESRVTWEEVCAHAEGIIALWGGERSLLVQEADPLFIARRLRDAFDDRSRQKIVRVTVDEALPGTGGHGQFQDRRQCCIRAHCALTRVGGR